MGSIFESIIEFDWNFSDTILAHMTRIHGCQLCTHACLNLYASLWISSVCIDDISQAEFGIVIADITSHRVLLHCKF